MVFSEVLGDNRWAKMWSKFGVNWSEFFLKIFSQLFVHNSSFQVDMVEIKEVYSKTHQRSLADDIHAHCKEEDLRDILLSLIKGN